MPTGKDNITEGWRFVSIGFEGADTDVSGVNPWQVEWTSTRHRITVAHPQYPDQRHLFTVWQVTGTEPPLTFAAGEFSNGVWGFYAPA